MTDTLNNNLSEDIVAGGETSVSDIAGEGCACGIAGCDGNHDHDHDFDHGVSDLAFTPSVMTAPPAFEDSQPICTCASHDPIAAEYEASLTDTRESDANVILSSEALDGAPLIHNAPGDPLPGGNQFYVDFTVNWQGQEREEFQVFFQMAEPNIPNPDQADFTILFWQFFGTDQVALNVTLNGVKKEIIVAGPMWDNGIKHFTVQITDEGMAQIFVDGRLRKEEFVGDVSGVPRDTFEIGDNSTGFGAKMWGEFLDFRADIDGDGLEDIVDVPPARLPAPFTPEPIPDLPNPDPDGFYNSTALSNRDRVTSVEDSGNSIIDAVLMGSVWKGEVIAFSFNVQDIDNNGIADFDEGNWREFYTGILSNVTDLTGVHFWERPEGEGTIQFQLTPGGGGASGVPGLGAARNTGTKVGIGGTVEGAGNKVSAGATVRF